MGDFRTSLVNFLMSASLLPLRESCDLANCALRIRCCGVWACAVQGRQCHELRAESGKASEERTMAAVVD
jgi:hypothetical protein